MTEQLCPVCSCVVIGTGYEKEGVTYCCEPCASGGRCVCGCCAAAEEPEEET